MKDLLKLDIHYHPGSMVRVFDEFFGECRRYEVKVFDPADNLYTLQNGGELIWRDGMRIYDDECVMPTREEWAALKKERDDARDALKALNKLLLEYDIPNRLHEDAPDFNSDYEAERKRVSGILKAARKAQS